MCASVCACLCVCVHACVCGCGCVHIHSAGQSYEIKLKKIGDLSEYHGKCLRVSDYCGVGFYYLFVYLFCYLVCYLDINISHSLSDSLELCGFLSFVFFLNVHHQIYLETLSKTPVGNHNY